MGARTCSTRPAVRPNSWRRQGLRLTRRWRWRPAPDAPGAERRLWYDTAVTLIVALVAAAASYGHMLHVALMAVELLWVACAFLVTIDGLALAALRRGEMAGPVVAAVPLLTL